MLVAVALAWHTARCGETMLPEQTYMPVRIGKSFESTMAKDKEA